MSDLGQAYVQIIPKATGISNKISNLIKPGSAKAGQSAGVSIAGGIKKALIAAGIGVAVTKLIKGAVEEGGKLEQSYGGLETIYGDAADQAKRFAWNASKAGISANEYAEQAVSFGASLKQAFGGDSTKAVKAANTAIMDMTDNAAKMGTPIENIQNAYQGFAKQNYTMLDNLKLGYGGTKTEMERLLSDAEKLTGVKYDINNLGDVYAAIHAVQEELGLTGVAAEEASHTFEGSLNALKANWKNLLGELALGGEEVGPMMAEFVSSAATFLFDNLIPMVGNVIQGLPEAIVTAVEVGGPKLLEAGKSILDWLINGIKTYAPVVIEAIPQVIEAIKTAITTYGPVLLEKGKEMLIKLVEGIKKYAPTVLSYIGDAITTFTSYLSEKLPEWGKKGGEMLRELGKSFVEHIPDMAEAIGKLNDWLNENIGNLAVGLLKMGGELMLGLAQGILEGIGNVVGPAMEDVVESIKKPIEAVKGWLSSAWSSIKSTASSAWSGMKSLAQTSWSGIKSTITKSASGIKSGLSTAWSSIKSTASTAWEGIKKVMTKPIEAAKKLITDTIKTIKSLFPFKIGKIINLQIPTITMKTGSKTVLGKTITYPTGFDISWHAKGGIVDGATLIGAGEKGAEAIVPLDPFWKRMDRMEQALTNNGGDVIVNLNYEASDDADTMLRDLARGIRRYKRAGAF